MGTVVATLAIITLTAIALQLAMSRYPRVDSHAGSRVTRLVRPIWVPSSAVTLFLVVQALPGPLLHAPLLAVFYCGAWAFDVLNVAFMIHLGDTFPRLYKHLPASTLGHGALRRVASYARGYMPRRYALVSAIALLAALLAVARLDTSRALLTSLPTALLAFGAPRAARVLRGLRGPPFDSIFLGVDPTIPLQPLRTSARAGSFIVDGPPRHRPETILLVINESTGDALRSSDPAGGPLRDQLRLLSGRPSDWFVPSNVVTNSACTDVSIPSILTGSGAHESIDKLHAMPFLFDMAKAAGYETSLFTSSVLNWANFEAFLAGAPIDKTFSAECTDKPFVNDLCIDDMHVVAAVQEHLQAARGPQFIVLYTNALHVPYQSESIVPIPDRLRDRRSRAVYLIETAHKLLFDTLHAAGRYDDALIFTVGDHGETADESTSIASPLLRLESYCDAILRPLFLVKAPHDLPPAMRRNLQSNRAALIANVDIAPTIADLLSIRLANGHRYAGQSLFARIPSSRLAISINTNEWRSWIRTAVSMARGTERLVFDSQLGCQYYDAGGTPLTPRNKSARTSALLAEAYRTPILRENMARLFRDRAQIAAAEASGTN